MSSPSLNQFQVSGIEALVKQEKPTHDIAKFLNLRPEHVHRYLCSTGRKSYVQARSHLEPYRKRSPVVSAMQTLDTTITTKILSDEDIVARILDMHNKGYTPTQISSKLSKSKHTIERIHKTNDLMPNIEPIKLGFDLNDIKDEILDLVNSYHSSHEIALKIRQKYKTKTSNASILKFLKDTGHITIYMAK